MSKNTSCNECQNVIKKEGDFINQDDKTLYGYPRYYQTNLEGKTTTFSYDSDEDEYDWWTDFAALELVVDDNFNNRGAL